MKKNLKKITLVVSLIIILILFSIQSSVIHLQSDVESENNEMPRLNLDPIIIIDEDSDFLAFPGYGNKTHPYLIQNYNIQSDWEPLNHPLNCCIIVANTTKHFVIQNNTLRQGYSAIRIENVTPGTAKIVDNDISNSVHCLYMKNVTGAVIDDNYVFSSETYTNVFLENCHDCNITNNLIKEVGYDVFAPLDIYCDGIRLEGCTGINIINNEITQCEQEAINILSSSAILVQTNYIHDCDHLAEPIEAPGVIALTSSSSSTIYNNTIIQNLQGGNIYTYLCDDILINENILSDGNGVGINMRTTTNSNITWNEFTDHPDHAVSIWQGGGNNIIHHNRFTDNNPGGTSQAADYSSNNVWYDATTNQGNWWNDWTGGDYRIDGTSESVDPYPLGDPIPIPEFTIKIGFIVITLPLIAVIFLNSIRKKRK